MTDAVTGEPARESVLRPDLDPRKRESAPTLGTILGQMSPTSGR
jgi:hypothetical protein